MARCGMILSSHRSVTQRKEQKMKNMQKLAALAALGGIMLQFGGCWNYILLALGEGLATSIISQIFPIGVRQV
jgi:hypothetical protein